MKGPPRVVGEPGDHLGMFVGRVVVHDGMDHFSGRNGVLDLVEESDELSMAVPRAAAPKNRSLQRAQCREQRGGAVADIVVRKGRALAALERQPGLGAVERLDLALLVDRQDDRVTGGEL